MKKVLIVIVSIVAILWLVLKLFVVFSSSNILSNEAVFQVYIDIPENEIDDYFGIPIGTYDKEQHNIVVKLPVELQGFNAGEHIRPINSIENINCTEEYNERKHRKFVSYELKGTSSKIFLLKNSHQSLAMFSEKLHGKRLIVASKKIVLKYKKGTINNILISKNGISNYCK